MNNTPTTCTICEKENNNLKACQDCEMFICEKCSAKCDGCGKPICGKCIQLCPNYISKIIEDCIVCREAKKLI